MLAREDDRTTYSVSELTASARLLLEERFPMIWVEGELSNLRIPSSGHWYFTLKDDRAQVRCAMFKNRNRFVRFDASDGMQVLVRGRISLYEARGDFQLIADHVEPAGEGALRAAFEALKRSLGAEGLFDPTHKTALPDFPRHVAVISSSTGAALRDIVAVFKRRAPNLQVTLLPSAVQGPTAEAQLLRAFDQLAAWPKQLGRSPDVILLARGGGSMEDLWSFNLESVARAIAASVIPVVSAVGHETDITIADFVADLRAPTPSAGAELIAPDIAALAHVFATERRRLAGHADRAISDASRHLHHVTRRLVDPRRTLQQQAQQVDEAEQRLARFMSRHLDRTATDLGVLRDRLRRGHPGIGVQRMRLDLGRLEGLLQRNLSEQVRRSQSALESASRALHAVSPLQTLSRGYAIVATPDGSRWGSPVTRAEQLTPGTAIDAHLDDGTVHATIDSITERPGDDDASG